MGLIPIHVDLIKHVKFDVFLRDKLANLLVVSRLLIAKLVARKCFNTNTKSVNGCFSTLRLTKDAQSFAVMVLLVQFYQLSIMGFSVATL